MKTFLWTIYGIGIGFAFGVLMVILGFVFEKDRSLIYIWHVIHKPALLIAHFWINSSLPPHGEVSWFVVPTVMILTQWSLTGFLLGLCWGCVLRVRTRCDAGKAAQKDDK